MKRRSKKQKKRLFWVVLIFGLVVGYVNVVDIIFGERTRNALQDYEKNFGSLIDGPPAGLHRGLQEFSEEWAIRKTLEFYRFRRNREISQELLLLELLHEWLILKTEQLEYAEEHGITEELLGSKTKSIDLDYLKEFEAFSSLKSSEGLLDELNQIRTRPFGLLLYQVRSGISKEL